MSATPQQTTIDLVRGFFGTLPKGSRFYLTTLEKEPTGLANEIRILDVIEEIRDAADDETVGRITVLLLYDEPEPARQETQR